MLAGFKVKSLLFSKIDVLLTVAVQAIKLSEACDHYLWNFKREVTQKARFLEQATKICAGDIDKLRVCEAHRYIYIYRRIRVFRIRIGFNADPDPAFYLNADPDPGSRTRANPDPGPGGKWGFRLE
jgi:hypothetical protein